MIDASPATAPVVGLVGLRAARAPEVAPTASVERVAVEDYADQEGHTASVWVQGNSSMVEGADVCHDQTCAVTDADGWAHVTGLPDGPVALTIDAERGVPLLLPLTRNNRWAPHLAARSLTADIYRDWMGPGAWSAGEALIDIWPIDASRDGSPVMPGVQVSASDGELWAVPDLSSARRDDTSTGSGPLWVAGVSDDLVELTLTLEGGLCSARSVGWDPTRPRDRHLRAVRAAGVSGAQAGRSAPGRSGPRRRTAPPQMQHCRICAEPTIRLASAAHLPTPGLVAPSATRAAGRGGRRGAPLPDCASNRSL